MKILYRFKYLVLLLCFACEDFIEEEPTNQISNDIVFTTPEDGNSLILGMYEDGLQDADMYGEGEIGINGLLSDELVHTGSFPALVQYDINEVASQNGDVFGYWDANYEGIFLANFVLANIDGVTFADPSFKNQLTGEALWGRALYHFNLVKFFGDVPIADSPNLNDLNALSRSPQSEVLAFIISDLEQAITLLDGIDVGSKNRASEWAAKALLARVQLFAGNLQAAGTLANDVIENGPFTLEPNYVDIFAGASGETIFEVFFSTIDGNSLAFFFQETGRYEYAPSPQLVAAYEEGDARQAVIGETGAGEPMAIKYTDVGNGSDQPIVLRLAEMHLIRAEARIGTAQADADVNLIRERAGLAPIAGATLDDILQERFVEFTFEGLRWLDLVRTGRVDAVMSAINPATWQATDALLPIPQTERNNNPNLTQNPGY